LAQGERRIAYPFMVGAAAVFAGIWLYVGAPRPDSGYDLMSVEGPSEDLMRSGVHDVVFTFDNPFAYGMPNEAGRVVPEFFFRRAHASVRTLYVDVGGVQDPNLTMLRAAAPRSAAIIWMYDKGIKGTRARRFRPRIEKLDPNYACRLYGIKGAGVVACVDTRYSRPLPPDLHPLPEETGDDT
jgi:hypothetical protein